MFLLPSSVAFNVRRVVSVEPYYSNIILFDVVVCTCIHVWVQVATFMYIVHTE